MQLLNYNNHLYYFACAHPIPSSNYRYAAVRVNRWKLKITIYFFEDPLHFNFCSTHPPGLVKRMYIPVINHCSTIVHQYYTSIRSIRIRSHDD
ncbi:unnamed protein product [Dicrocoelium dendriticum]|nr:unnamed protein product [Dicrocoelium dendriticum]